MRTSTKAAIKTHSRVLLQVLIGCLIYSVGMNLFYTKEHLLSGGLTGFAQLIHYQFGLPISLMVVLLNIPLFLVGWKFVNRQFFIYSLCGIAIFSVCIQLGSHLSISYDSPLTSVALGGVLTGLGLGIIYRSGASTGGSDILAKIFNKYFSLNMATTGLIINVIVVSSSMFIYGIDQAVLTLSAMFLASHVTSYVIDGIDHRRAITIITSDPKPLSNHILKELGRGVTVTHATGAYTNDDRYILYCVISKRQLSPLKMLIKRVDPHAFFTITTVNGVYGRGSSFFSFSKID